MVLFMIKSLIFCWCCTVVKGIQFEVYYCKSKDGEAGSLQNFDFRSCFPLKFLRFFFIKLCQNKYSVYRFMWLRFIRHKSLVFRNFLSLVMHWVWFIRLWFIRHNISVPKAKSIVFTSILFFDFHFFSTTWR